MTNKPQYISLPFAWNQSTMNRKNASNPPPPGAMVFQATKRRLGAFAMWPRFILEIFRGTSHPSGRYRQEQENTHTPHTQRKQCLVLCRRLTLSGLLLRETCILLPTYQVSSFSVKHPFRLLRNQRHFPHSSDLPPRPWNVSPTFSRMGRFIMWPRRLPNLVSMNVTGNC